MTSDQDKPPPSASAYPPPVFGPESSPGSQMTPRTAPPPEAGRSVVSRLEKAFGVKPDVDLAAPPTDPGAGPSNSSHRRDSSRIRSIAF